MAHAYIVGQTVKLEANLMTRPVAGNFVVTRLVPDEDGRQPRYRVKSERENFERVVAENECDIANPL